MLLSRDLGFLSEVSCMEEEGDIFMTLIHVSQKKQTAGNGTKNNQKGTSSSCPVCEPPKDPL